MTGVYSRLKISYHRLVSLRVGSGVLVFVFDLFWKKLLNPLKDSGKGLGKVFVFVMYTYGNAN